MVHKYHCKSLLLPFSSQLNYLQVTPIDTAAVTKAGLAIDDEFDIMGDIFIVSVHPAPNDSQTHERHSSCPPLTMRPRNILPWFEFQEDPAILPLRNRHSTLTESNGSVSRTRRSHSLRLRRSHPGGPTSRCRARMVTSLSVSPELSPGSLFWDLRSGFILTSRP